MWIKKVQKVINLLLNHTHLEEVDGNTQQEQEAPNFFAKFMTPKDLEKGLGLSIAQQYKLRSARFREQNAKKVDLIRT
ncbi:hypothetical protein [Helicobacter fennelliae]|uniref:Uncharacterized protein n=1 Tax=Helicobacter fennelliae MRY12-0050 TaxID=1325130 RepID=T1D4R7_9HELI|nr:hypothetical protein [Helicobacter fennelliae]GAD20176.1 hypothetical protein HFN_1420 [Helicobacter fennelliae MRY12-0050]